MFVFGGIESTNWNTNYSRDHWTVGAQNSYSSLFLYHYRCILIAWRRFMLAWYAYCFSIKAVDNTKGKWAEVHWTARCYGESGHHYSIMSDFEAPRRIAHEIAQYGWNFVMQEPRHTQPWYCTINGSLFSCQPAPSPWRQWQIQICIFIIKPAWWS